MDEVGQVDSAAEDFNDAVENFDDGIGDVEME